MQIYFQLQNVWNGVLPTFAAQTINMISKLQDLQNHFPRDIATLSHFSRNDCKFMPHFAGSYKQDLKTKQKTLWQIGLSLLVSFTLFVGFLHCIQFCPSPSEQGSAGYMNRMHGREASSSSTSR